MLKNLFCKLSSKVCLCLTIAFASIFGAHQASASEPSGYYDSCDGLYGRDLLEALEEVVSSHTNVGYNGLWTLYKTSDVYPDGKIWDIYSTKHWNANSERCGTYKSVGDCYNREHSFPKSWFDDASPMYSDAFHIYPTDGKVNGQRSNYPYGECANGTTLSAPSGIQALGKLGSSTFSGYSGTVFEPVDDYKGDVARSYFYMAACYNRLIDDWHSDMLAGNSYPAFSSWAINLLLKWHRLDPVSEKEIDRNEAIYASQHNRNPFIDHPDLAEHIWGTRKTQPWGAEVGPTATLAQPVNGKAYDFGILTLDEEAEVTIPVKGVDLASAVTVSYEATAGVSLSATTISAEQAMRGTTITAKWHPATATRLSIAVTFASGDAVSTVYLVGRAVDGLAAKNPIDITATAFTAVWSYAGNEASDGTYTIYYTPDGEGLDPEEVRAKATDGYCRIEGLTPETDYAYWVVSETQTSNEVVFTTGMAIPYIDVLYDGDLYPQAKPGEPSGAYELLVDAENIDSDIQVKVTAPFQLSSDKSNWATALTISPDEDRFYLRIYGTEVGTYSTVLRLIAGSYVNDEIEIEGWIDPNAASLPSLADYHQWDAFCRDGKLTIETLTPATVRVYGLDGLTYYDSSVSQGSFDLEVPKGLYIVAVGNFTRRVLVK